jgi:predicted NAD-dependent protein-ADP-ribosyltransferase YbiA (DUF1768 family)
MLLGEVADLIDRLNDRPDSAGRCREAVQAYLDEPTEDNRLAVRDRYLAIPRHLRIFSLGDMDRKDQPLRVLSTTVGEPLLGDDDGRIVTAGMHRRAIAYFRDRNEANERWQQREPPDGPARPLSATRTVSCAVFPNGWPDEPGDEVLQNDYPAVVGAGGRDYPSVDHAYWALSTPDESVRERIAATDRRPDVIRLAAQAPRRPDWPDVRLAVMSMLLRAKFTRHAGPAGALLSTGDARIVYRDWDAPYWSHDGTNWVGRLLELIRSELLAARTGTVS